MRCYPEDGESSHQEKTFKNHLLHLQLHISPFVAAFQSSLHPLPLTHPLPPHSK